MTYPEPPCEFGIVGRYIRAPAVRSRQRRHNSEAGRGQGSIILSGSWYIGVIMSCLSWSPGLIIGTLTMMLLIQANLGGWEAYLGDSVPTIQGQSVISTEAGE